MRVKNFFPSDGVGAELPLVMYVAWFDSARSVRVRKARVAGIQANALHALVLPMCFGARSPVAFATRLSARLGIRMERLQWRFNKRCCISTHSSLRGILAYGGAFSLTQYGQYGALCEAAFGNPNLVSLGWQKTLTDKPYSVIFATDVRGTGRHCES